MFRNKGYFFTYPNCELSKENFLAEIKISWPAYSYAIVAEEFHQTGNKHVHIQILFDEPVYWNPKQDASKWDVYGYHPNVQKSRSWKSVDEYCRKQGNFITDGIDLNKARQDRKQNTPTEILTMHPREAVESGSIKPLALPQLLKAQCLWQLLDEPLRKEACRGTWLWGVAGSGKSAYARELSECYGKVYIKPQNKWWDGYRGEPSVILDDLDTPVLGHYLKIWADRWEQTGEIKGGTIPLNFDRIIVTSNYAPADLFTEPGKNTPTP